MDATIYDTKEGIATMLGSLEHFCELAEARREAGYKRREQLHEFWLLGRFYTDSCGNLVQYKPSYFSDEVLSQIPAVLTNEEFGEIFRLKGIGDGGISRSGPMYCPSLPLPHVLDPISGDEWTIKNCHDYYPVESHEEIDLTSYVEETLGEVLEALKARTDGIYSYPWSSMSVRNDAYIGTPVDRVVNMDNPHGIKDIDENYIFQAGDKITVRVVRCYHADTYKIYLDRERVKELSDLQKEILEFLELCAFTDVHIIQQMVPAHVADDMKEEFNDEKDRQNFMTYGAYFRVETDEGSFGLIPLGEDRLWLDLTNTGITAQELGKVLGFPMDNNFTSCLVSFMDEVEQLLVFRRELLRRKIRTKT